MRLPRPRRPDASGWLWSWALAIPKTAPKQDIGVEVRQVRHRARSTSRRPVEDLPAAGRRCRRAPASPPTRSPSTGSRQAFAELTLDAIAGRADRQPRRPSVRACPGVQYVGIPEFQDVGNGCTQQFSAVIAGNTSIDAALKNCQAIASQAAQG